MPTKKPSRSIAAPTARSAMKIRPGAVAAASMPADEMREYLIRLMFAPAKPAPGVVPASKPAMALDDALNEWSLNGMSEMPSIALAASMIAEGQIFLGFPLLSELAQRPEFRTISNIFATEMTRKWIRFKGTGGKDGIDKTERIKQLEAAFKKFKIR